MIIKELVKKASGEVLYRTYSDTDHLIQQVASGNIYVEAIDVADNVEYAEVADKLPTSYDYEAITALMAEAESVAEEINRLDLTANESLAVAEFYPSWESRIGRLTEVGYIVLHEDMLWRVRQTHTPIAEYPPSLATASLYEVVEYEHEGTIDDPIPYAPPMEIFDGKYYTEDGVIYICTRDSGVALSHNLKDLINLYVQPVTI